MTPPRMPRLSRAAYRSYVFVHRQLARLGRLLAELPVALHDPEFERYVNNVHYADAKRYREPENQHAGLYPFEGRMLEGFFPPPPARLLVPGAGAGREMLALRARGYDVEGFDPVCEMVEAAKLALGVEAARVSTQSLAEWAVGACGRYDGIFTGWGMWTHIVEHEARVSALRAFRRACPSGPVVVSFWRGEPLSDPDEKGGGAVPLHPPAEARLEKLTREWLRRRVLGRPPVERGTGWVNGMFVHWVSEAELREEAELAGYDLAHYERDAARFPHAALLPREPGGAEQAE